MRSVAVMTAVLLVSRAAAAANPVDQAAAEALFTEGKRLVAAGDLDHACPKFAESNRLDPGSGTLLNLGACYEQQGRLASAWGVFKEAEASARAAGDDGRAGEAARRADAIAGRLPKLTIVVPTEARAPGFELKRDGTPIGEAQWGSSIPADAGAHTIEASAPGYRTWSTVVKVGPAGASLTVPPLAPDAATSSLKPLGIAAVSVGGAAIIAGLITLGVDASKHASLVKQCPGGSCPSTLASAVGGDVSAYHTLGVVTTVSLVAGGALGVAGVGAARRQLERSAPGGVRSCGRPELRGRQRGVLTKRLVH